jgi:hypothetical protein
MVKKISKALKWTFFIDFIVYIVFGFFLIFQQALFISLIGWPYSDPVMGYLLGAAFLAFGSSSFDAWKATNWDKVKISVVRQIVWLIFGSFLMFWSLFDRYFAVPLRSLPIPVPLVGWIFFAILFAFLVAYIVFYIQHEKQSKATS